ncbi:glycosyltransferase family 39 protein [Leptolyngbya sp. FACHB-261]|uniref:glycosyltransferase family 39 protein n=1 Tax=Leptolyngbya sp. FACHB-261 TaxID=2692806 RepID=UPI0016854D21|nr:glycosyltransferase family 39 protein [Leptolyngbya sp. FACHB-261]MBD2104799.1 glycosyltransferase family 39 protein [Leptolyngbya sp. FACHB-261]
MFRLAKSQLLLVLLVVGTGLRFWHLGDQPLWTDEVLSALFSLGKRLQDVPLDQVLEAADLRPLFQLNVEASLGSIAEAVKTDSTHPPLYFYLSHLWLRLLGNGSLQDLPWRLRSFTALTSSLGILAIYVLGRVAFRGAQAKALLLTALVAVSPFAVYLAQEARHYSLAILCLIGALTALFALLDELHKGRSLSLMLLLAWALSNAIGLYVHYFYLLAWLAQLVVLALALARSWHSARTQLLPWGLALGGVLLVWLPWLPTLLEHSGRGEVAWISRGWSNLDAVLQVVMLLPGTAALFVMLPLSPALGELQIVLVLLLLGLIGTGAWYLWRGGRLSGDAALPWAGLFVIMAMALLVGLGWAKQSRLTSVFRYNFIFLPGMLLVATACLSGLKRPVREQVIAAFLVVGLVSSSLAVQGWVLAQTGEPAATASRIRSQSQTPILFAQTYSDLNDVAKGLALSLELQRQDPQARIIFVNDANGNAAVLQKLTAVVQLNLPVDLWVTRALRTADWSGVACRSAEPERIKVSGEGYYHLICT